MMQVRMFEDVTISAVQAVWCEAQAKHGFGRTPANPEMSLGQALAILVEEVGEVAKSLTYDGYESDEGTVKELLQVAAMALAWVEGLEHRA